MIGVQIEAINTFIIRTCTHTNKQTVSLNVCVCLSLVTANLCVPALCMPSAFQVCHLFSHVSTLTD